jgi:hypothetical protein
MHSNRFDLELDAAARSIPPGFGAAFTVHIGDHPTRRPGCGHLSKQRCSYTYLRSYLIIFAYYAYIYIHIYIEI